MAGPVLGMTGSVSWANGTTGTNNAQLTSNAVTGGNPVSVTLALNADEFDVTAFNSTDPMTAFLKGLQSWSGEFEALLPSTTAGPQIGSTGLVTFPNGYVTNIKDWELGIERPVLDSTVFQATEKTFLPGLQTWGGRYSGFYDDTTVAVHPGHSNEPATLTLTYSERGATDATLSGSAFTTLADIAANPAALNTIAYTFRGSGALTHSTPSTGNSILTAGSALTHDSAGTITITASTGQTFTGSAFWTSIRLTVDTPSPMRVRVGFQGTGALAIS